MSRSLALAALVTSSCSVEIVRELQPGEVRGLLLYESAEGVRSPAGGAQVSLDGSGVGVKADEQGRFVLRNLPAGRIALRLQHDADGDGRVDAGLRLPSFALSDGKDLGAIVIGGLGSIDGQVLQESQAVARARVVVSREREGVASEAGTFVFSDLLPGQYAVAVIGTDGVYTRDVVVTPRARVSVAFQLDAMPRATQGSLVGYVRGAGHEGHAGGEVALVGSAHASVTGDDGLFDLPEVPPGVYTLVARRAGFLPLQQPLVVVAGDAELDDLLLVPDDGACALGGDAIGPSGDVDDDGVADDAEPPQCRCRQGTTDLTGNGLCDDADPDLDDDGVSNILDNCPSLSNASQLDVDLDGRGDACHPAVDTDTDGIPDGLDNCADAANDDQADSDDDGTGDACDACPLFPNESSADADSDGVPDDCDNCASDPNEAQLDGDSDGIGDVCDNCFAAANADQLDGDTDGHGDVCDNCLAAANAEQLDGDTDGHGDVCDNCLAAANADQVDGDTDGHGDVCDNCRAAANADQVDGDTDGRGDVCDNCPLVSNADQADDDASGVGDVCEVATGMPSICNDEGICWEHPKPSANIFGPMARIPGTSQFFVTNGTHMLRWNGRAFVLETLPPLGGRTLLGMHASSASEVWAAGHGGLVVHWNGTVWTVVDVGATDPIEYVWGDGAGTLFFTTSTGVHRFDGTTSTFDRAAGSIHGLTGRAGGEVYLLTQLGLQVRTDASVTGAWTDHSGGPYFYLAIAATPDDLWAVRTDYVTQEFLRWVPGTGWVSDDMLPAGGVKQLVPDPSGAVYALMSVSYPAEDTVHVHTVASGWRQLPGLPSGGSTWPNHLVVLSPSDLWAAGVTASLWRSNGVVWTEFNQESPREFTSLGGGIGSGPWLTTTRSKVHAFDGSTLDEVVLPAKPPHLLTTSAGVWLASAGPVFHSYDGVQWTSRAPIPGFTGELFGMYAVGPDDVFAFGTDGDMADGKASLVWRYTGGSWTRLPDPFTYSVGAMSGPITNLWAMSREGDVARWDGTAWVDAYSVGGYTNGLWAGAAAVAVAGDNGLVWRGGDQPWTDLSLLASLPRPTTLRAVSGVESAGAVELWAVGDGGLMLRSPTGTTRVTVLPDVTGGNLNGLWQDGTSLWAAGEAILRRDAGAWTVVRPRPVDMGRLTSVFAASETDAWAIGWDGATLHSDGSGDWKLVESPTKEPLYSIHGSASDDVWAVGEMGTAMHWDGTRWTRRNDGLSFSMTTVFAVSPTRAWAGNASADAWRWNGTTWAQVGTSLLAFKAISAISEVGGLTLAVGGEGLVAAFDAPLNRFTPLTVPGSSTAEYRAVSLLPSGEAWVVGMDATALHRSSAGAWTELTFPTGLISASAELDAVFARAPDEVWVGGVDASGMLLLRWDGVRWTRSEGLGYHGIAGLAGAGGKVWAAGDGRMILRVR